MSLTNFQNNRVVHRNDTSQIQLGNDRNTLIKANNNKLDSQIAQQTAVNTKLDQFSGAINNSSIGDGTVKLQTYVYGHDSTAGQARALKVDSNGRLECNVSDIELHTGDIALSVDGLETLIGTTNTKLQQDLDFAGQPNPIGDGSNMKRVMNYGHDSTGGQQRPLAVDSAGMLKVVVDSGATSGNQTTQIGHLSEIEEAVENVELTVGTNSATAPTRSLQIGGKYSVDGTFRDVKVDNDGKVIIDSPAGSDINTRLDGITTAVGTSNTKLAGGLPSSLGPGGGLQVEDAGSQFALGLLGSGQSTTNTLLTSLDNKANTRDGHLNNIVNQTSGIASESTLGDIHTVVDDRLPPSLTTAGNLKVSIEEEGGLASESTLSSLNGKITTGADLTLSSAQQNLVYGVDAFNTSQLEPIRISSDKVMCETFIASVASGITNELPTSNSKITQGSDATLTQAQQVLSYGRTSGGDLKPIHITNNGDVEVEIADMIKGQDTASNSLPVTDARNKVVDTSFLSNEAISNGTMSSTTLDTLGYAKVVLYGEQDSGTTVSNNSLKIMGSNASAGSYFHIGSLATQTYISGRTMLIENVPIIYGAHPRYIKIYNDNGSSANITLRAIMSDFNEYQ